MLLEIPAKYNILLKSQQVKENHPSQKKEVDLQLYFAAELFVCL